MNTATASSLTPMSPERFFRQLYGEDPPGYLSVCTFTNQVPKVQWVKASDYEAAGSLFESLAREHDGYFGVCLHGETKGNKRGNAADVIAMPGLWAELDWHDAVHKKRSLPPSREDVLVLIAEFPLQPTMVILSGHGVHVWWLYRELWIFENEGDNAAAAKLSRGFQQWFINKGREHGWEFDNTSDLARVLRPPGTWNRKREPAVQVEAITEAGPRYNPSDFEPFLELPFAPVPEAAKPVQDKPRHDALRSMSVKLARAGLPPDAAYAALQRVRDKHLSQEGRAIPDREIWDLVNTAAAKYQAEPEPETPIAADLAEWRTEEQIAYTIEPLLPSETLALLAAPGKTGKSLLVLCLMLWAGAALGGKLFGILKPPTEPKRILLFDFENGPRRLRRRIRSAVQGGGITVAQADAALTNITAFCGMKYARQALDAGLLRQQIDTIRPDLVVIDPLRPMLPAGGSENDSVVVGPVLDGIRAAIQGTGASVILIDHVGHADKGRPRGSTAKLDAVDFVWNLSRDKDDVSRLIFEVTHDRDDVGVSQFGLALKKDRSSFRFERVNIGPSGLAREIVEYLDQYGPTPQPKLAKAMGESASSVRDAVARLRQANQIEDDGRTDSGAKVVKVRRADGLTEGDGG